MIDKILTIITFITSSICFIELVKDKKKYRSLALLITIILFILFIRPILIIWHDYHRNVITFIKPICVIAIVISLPLKFPESECGLDFREKILKYIKSGSKYNWVIIFSLCSLIFSTAINKSYESLEELKDARLFFDANKEFSLHLKEIRTNNALYEYIFDNLQVVVLNIWFILTFIFVIMTIVTSTKILICNDEYYLKKHIKKAVIYLLILTAGCIISPFILNITNYLFQEFEWLSPQIQRIACQYTPCHTVYHYICYK